MTLQPSAAHPHGLTDADFDSIFTTDKPVVFAYHGYPWLIHRLTYKRANHDNLHVRGYKEEGTTTTPFDMTVLNDLDRFHLAALEDDGVVRAVAGYRFQEKLLSGQNLYVDDLVTDSTHRSRGHGRRLLSWLVKEARAHGCVQLELDSGVQRFDAHRFYFRERMHVSAYHFVQPLTL